MLSNEPYIGININYNQAQAPQMHYHPHPHHYPHHFQNNNNNSQLHQQFTSPGAGTNNNQIQYNLMQSSSGSSSGASIGRSRSPPPPPISSHHAAHHHQSSPPMSPISRMPLSPKSPRQRQLAGLSSGSVALVSSSQPPAITNQQQLPYQQHLQKQTGTLQVSRFNFCKFEIFDCWKHNFGRIFNWNI